MRRGESRRVGWVWSPPVVDGPRFALLNWPAAALRGARRLLGRGGADRGGGSATLRWAAGERAPEAAAWVWQPCGEVAGLRGAVWVEVGAGGWQATIVVRQSSPPLIEQVVGRLVPAVLGELALPQGWVLLHAAAGVWRGGALAFPGRSQVGKTTVAGAAAALGWPVLADDLVWVKATGTDPPPVVGLPRGPAERAWAAPAAALTAWVFPSLGGEGERAVRRLPPRLALPALWEAWIGLGAPNTVAARLAACSRQAKIRAFSWVRPRLSAAGSSSRRYGVD